MGNKKSRMVRISCSLDEYLEDLSKNLSIRLDRPVSKTEASRILAAQEQQTRVVMIKKRGKKLGLGSEIMWL